MVDNYPNPDWSDQQELFGLNLDISPSDETWKEEMDRALLFHDMIAPSLDGFGISFSSMAS